MTMIKLDLNDAIAHTWIVGSNTAGKSNTLLYRLHLMAEEFQDGCPCAIIFIDPHGDAAINLVQSMKSWDNVTILDPNYVSFGLNPLELPKNIAGADRITTIQTQVEQLVGILWEIFKTDLQTAPRLIWIFRGALYYLYTFPESPTFRDLYFLLSDMLTKDKEELAEMLKQRGLEDQIIDKTMEAISKLEKNAFTAVINRISNFVLPAESITSRTFCSRESRLDFEKMLEPGNLTIFRLSKFQLPPDFGQLLTATVVIKLFFIVQKRARDLERAGKGPQARTPVILAIDEFQNIANLSIVETILTEARKFGLYLWMVHQNLGQLNDEVLNTVLGNAGTIFSFRVGSDDASRLAKVMTPQKEREMATYLASIPNHQVAVRKNPVGGSGLVRTIAIPYPKLRDALHTDQEVIELMKTRMEQLYGGAHESTELTYRSVVDTLRKDGGGAMLNPVKWRILTLAYQYLLSNALMLEYGQLSTTLYRRYEWKQSVVHGALSDLVVGGLLDERYELRDIVKGRDDYGNQILVTPDPSKKDEMERARTVTYSLATPAKEFFLSRVGSSRAGNPVHLRVIRKLLEEKYWPGGYWCEVDWGEKGGKSPDIAVFRPKMISLTKKDGTEAKVPDPYHWDAQEAIAVEVEEYPSKHPDRVLENYRKNRGNYRDIVFVVTMPEQVDDIRSILDQNGIDPMTYRIEVVPFSDLNTNDVSIAEVTHENQDGKASSSSVPSPEAQMQATNAETGSNEKGIDAMQTGKSSDSRKNAIPGKIYDPEEDGTVPAGSSHEEVEQKETVSPKRAGHVDKVVVAKVLWYLASQGFKTREDAGRSCGISARTVSRALAYLESRGLIERHGKDEISVTEKGHGVLGRKKSAAN
jgi:hypothetical protein